MGSSRFQWRNLEHEGGADDPGNHHGRGCGPLPGGLFDEGRCEAQGARVQGSKRLPRPNQEDRVWVLFDWDVEGWQSFVSDPEVPPIIKEAGHKDVPQAAAYSGRYDA